jgi:hypothetical protein
MSFSERVRFHSWPRHSKCQQGYPVSYSVYDFSFTLFSEWARGSVFGKGTMLQAGRSRVRVPMRRFFFNLPIPSSRTMALGSTQPLTEMSTRNLTALPPSVSRLSRENVGAWTSHNPMNLHGLLQG